MNQLKFLLTADDKASAAFAKVRGELNSMGGAAGKLKSALGGLGPTLVGALSVAGLSAFAKATIDGIDRLNDLKDATGASIENLSALEDVAARTGTGIDTAGAALLKLNQQLNAASDPKSGAAQALNALGLSVAELKRLDPVQALQRVGKALAGFNDDGNKGRIIFELLGKSTRDLAPLLKDLAEAGELQATVTTQQAEAAEAFNKQLFGMQKNATDAARSIAGPLVAAVNELFDVINGKGSGKIDEMLAVPLQAVTVLGANVAFVLKGIGTEIGGIAAQAAAVARLDFSGAAAIGQMMRDDAAAARKDFDNWERRLGAIGSSPQASYSNEGRNSVRAKPSLPGALPVTDGKAKAAAKKAWEVDTLQVYQAEQLREAFEAIEKINRDWQPVEFINSADLYEAELLRKAFEEIEVVNQRAQDELQKSAKGAKDMGRDVGEEIGLIFGSAAGRAIAEFQSLREILKGVLADLAQIAIKKAVTDPLSSFVTEGLKGFSLASILPKFATGTDYVPRDMPAIVHKGERIIPASQNRPGVGGITLTSAPVITIDSRTDAATVGQMVAQAVRMGNEQLMGQLKASGVVA